MSEWDTCFINTEFLRMCALHERNIRLSKLVQSWIDEPEPENNKLMDEWKSVDEELPPTDGVYLLCSISKPEFFSLRGMYDGFGFVNSQGEYFPDVKYWKKITPVVKRYGKINLPISKNDI